MITNQKYLQQLCTTFVQLTWPEHVTKSHWVCSSRTWYKVKQGEIPSKVWEVKTLIVLTYARKNNIFQVLIRCRSSKVTNSTLATLGVSSKHHRLAQLAGQAADKSQMSDCLFRQKEHTFCLTFLIGWPMPNQWRQ